MFITNKIIIKEKIRVTDYVHASEKDRETDRGITCLATWCDPILCLKCCQKRETKSVQNSHRFSDTSDP